MYVEGAQFTSIDQLVARQAAVWRILAFAALVTTLVLAVAAYARSSSALPLVLAMFALGTCSIVLRPMYGVYLIAFFGALGDAVVAPWYPFVKNLSSRESIYYVDDSISVSPLEFYLVLTLAVWIVGVVASRPLASIRRGDTLLPLAIFTGFVLYALGAGVTSGGDRTVALFEARSLFYPIILYVIVVNLVDEWKHVYRIAWLLALAIAINALFGIDYIFSLTALQREELESVVEHPTALQMNLLIVMTAAAWLQRGISLRWRVSLTALLVPTIYVYLVSERRAAIIALAAAGLVGAIRLYWNHRRTFWRVMPPITVLFIGYLGAFWNAQGVAGFPAQSVKSVIAPDQLSASDQASDAYRYLENVNLLSTIKARPIAGLGFGHKFFRPVSLPDISVFEFWEYIPHNSILYIWMKLGVFGFVAMLWFFARSVRTGAAALNVDRAPKQTVVLVTFVTFVLGFAIFAYVDMAWTPRTMIFLGIALGVIDAVRHLDHPRTPAERP